MGRKTFQQVADGDFALGWKSATVIVLLGLMAALADRLFASPMADNPVVQMVAVSVPTISAGAQTEAAASFEANSAAMPPAKF